MVAGHTKADAGILEGEPILTRIGIFSTNLSIHLDMKSYVYMYAMLSEKGGLMNSKKKYIYNNNKTKSCQSSKFLQVDMGRNFWLLANLLLFLTTILPPNPADC